MLIFDQLQCLIYENTSKSAQNFSGLLRYYMQYIRSFTHIGGCALLSILALFTKIKLPFWRLIFDQTVSLIQENVSIISQKATCVLRYLVVRMQLCDEQCPRLLPSLCGTKNILGALPGRRKLCHQSRKTELYTTLVQCICQDQYPFKFSSSYYKDDYRVVILHNFQRICNKIWLLLITRCIIYWTLL